MSFIDEKLRSGFQVAEWNQFPIYPGSQWFAKLTLETADLEGHAVLATMSHAVHDHLLLTDTVENANKAFEEALIALGLNRILAKVVKLTVDAYFKAKARFKK